MITQFLGARACKVMGGVALGTFALAAQADPIALQGVCHLTSVIAGQGKCQMTYLLEDDATAGPASIKASTIKIDGTIVARYLNDSANPAQFSVQNVSGATEVSCGASHVVTAFITRVGLGTLPEHVGSLPAVLCPTAP